jgi:hypothetical protein
MRVRRSLAAEFLLQVGHVRVFVDRGLTPGDRLGEPHPIDDRGVVELVADDDVSSEERCRHRLIGVPALTKLREAAVPTSRAQAASNSRCMVNVPHMKRTEAVPAP